MNNKSILTTNIITTELISYYRSNIELAIKDYYIITYNNRGLDKSKLNGYFEKHHRIPKCMGGSNNEDNLVLLTYDEHIKAHLLLHIIYPHITKLTYSLCILINVEFKNGILLDKDIEIDTSLLSFLREEFSESKSGPNHHLFGKHLSEETKKKLSESHKNIPHGPMSEETKKKLSEINTGRKASEEARKKMSESQRGEKNGFYGKHHTEETKKKLSESSRKTSIGRYHTEETKKKLSELNKGKHHTEETKKKLSEINTGKKASEETRKKMSESQKGEKNGFYGKHHTEEAKQKLSESHKGFKNFNYGKHFSEEHKRKISESNGLSVISPDGKIYSSMKDAGKAFGVSRKTIRNWIDKHPEKGFKFAD